MPHVIKLRSYYMLACLENRSLCNVGSVLKITCSRKQVFVCFEHCSLLLNSGAGADYSLTLFR